MNILHWLGSGNLPKDPDKTPVSGVVRAALELGRAQRQRGHSVTIGCAGTHAWEAEWEGVQLIGRPPARWARKKLYGRTMDFSQHVPLWKLTRSRPYDVVHSHLYAYLRGIRAGIRVVHFHVDPLYGGADGTGFSKADFDSVYHNADIIVAVSRYIEQQLKDNLPSDLPIGVVANGVRQAASTNELDCRASEMRRKLGIRQGDFVIAYAGAIVEEKGLKVLAEAFRRLRPAGGLVHLIIAGSGRLWDGALVKATPYYEEEVRELLKGEVAAGRAHFLGGVAAESMPSVYSAGDVFVAPSVWPEPFSLVCLEAMSCGRPIVASRIGGLPEVVTEQSGRLFNPGDIAGCARAIEELRADAALRRALGQAALRRSQMYTWANAAEMVDGLYQRALFRRGMSSRWSVGG